MDNKIDDLIPTDVNVLDYWKEVPLEDINALMLYQKIEHSINDFIEVLNALVLIPKEPSSLYSSYVWSVSIRDFTVLLRDSLLGVAKHDQFEKDARSVSDSYQKEVQTIVQKAAQEIGIDLKNQSDLNYNYNDWEHQKSPVSEVVLQLKELEKQCKKIYRSISKVDDVRTNTVEYIRDFQLQYSLQTSAIHNLFSIVEDVNELASTVIIDFPEDKIDKIADEIGDKIQKLEFIKGTESIEILAYPNKETLSLPVSTDKTILNFKSINVKSEFARWFSSFIYPKIIELESKRDNAVEKCLMAFRQIQTKIAAISFSELSSTADFQKEIEVIFNHLNKDVLLSLKEEEEENNILVMSHLDENLIASNVYSKDVLFLPESGSYQISNLSKDAQKRIVGNFVTYKKEFKTYLNKVLSRYIEVDQTSYSQFIKNKLSINEEDESLALLLKNGYLGKSFTVPRPEIIDSIVEDYKLWLEGFAGAILLSGLTGSGKSTALGMLSHLGLNEEIIQLKRGESYFIGNRSFEVNCDLKKMIDEIVKRTQTRRVIVCIDDLEQWHDDEHDLFDNINHLINSIAKHKKNIFFVVTCSTFLKERLKIFKDLRPFFSSRLSMGEMNSNQVKTALNLRARVNNFENKDEEELEYRLGYIVRETKGNPGYAMLEYCRLYNDEYKTNVKSQEFAELIKTYKTILTYICSNHYCSIKILSNLLSDIDFRDTMQSIDHLVGQKILITPKKGYISLNPLLIHTVEDILDKVRK
jgi:hypothetical protein